MALNREWHRKNTMPKDPTIDQRVNWHLRHAKHCDCREMPAAIKAEIEQRQRTHLQKQS